MSAPARVATGPSKSQNFGGLSIASNDYDTVSLATVYPEKITIIPSPSHGQFGNASLGVIRIEPAILDLIQFWQSKFLYLCKSEPTSSLPYRALELSLQALSDDLQAHGVIAALASYQALLTDSSEMKALQVQSYSRAVRTIRQRLGEIQVPVRLIGATNMLIGAEFAAKNFAAASYHTKFLVQMLKPKPGDTSPAFLRLRHTSMVLELERATATFSHPLMDISEWVLHDQLHGPWPLMVDFDVPDDTVDIDAIGDSRLLDLLLQLRYYDTVLQSPWMGENISQGNAYQLSWKFLTLGAQLLDYAIEADATAHGQLERSQQAAAALAALFLFRLRTRSEYARHLNLKTQQTMMERCWAQGPGLVTRIRALMEQSDSAAQALIPKGLGPELRLRLWILYVGSIIEDTAEYYQERPSYCTRALGEYIAVFGLDEDLVQQYCEAILLPKRSTGEISGPQWLTPELRTWGFPNWNGEVASFRNNLVRVQ